MVKGETFSHQLFENEAFRHFINTFLNKESGITKGCQLTQTSSTITIGEGYFVIKGGLLREKTGTTLNIPTQAGYYKLVYEIDLTKINTSLEFNQGSYKFIRSVGDYPVLTQQDLDNGGTVYQFEFCQFRITESGIADYVDKRTFLDFDNIYEEIRDTIEGIEDTSDIVFKHNLDYSTEEKLTGATWIDGKPIYRKTFYGDSIPNKEKTIDISSLNVDTIFFITDKSYLYWSATTSANPGRWAPIIQTAVSRVSPSEPEVGYYQAEVYTNPSNRSLVINCGKNMIIGKWALTIEYTKTTD